MSEIKAVIFDIDDTLPPGNAWILTTLALGASVDEHLRIYQEHKNDLFDCDHAWVDPSDLWQATGKASKSYFQQLFNGLPLFEGAQEVISKAQERCGRPVCRHCRS